MQQPTFTPPGPGRWRLDRSHYPGGATPISQWLIGESMAAGMEQVFAESGVPARRIEARFVHGFMYTRLVPLVGGDRDPGRMPPDWVLWTATRLHPEFRRRTARAKAALRDRPSLEVAARWEAEIRPRLASSNRQLQAVELDGPDAVDDRTLQVHIADLLDHVRETCELHFWLHGHDLGPIARLLHAVRGWGIDPREIVPALSGASPATVAPLTALCALRDEIGERDVASFDDVRAVSPTAAKLLDEYLDERGSVLATGYDVTSFTLRELPGVVLASIREAKPPDTGAWEQTAAAVRARIPEQRRDEFDDLLGDARAVTDMRDDNGPLTAEWPLGLLRLALLAAGRRLAARGELVDAEHTLELIPEEARRVFESDRPTGEELAARAAARLAAAAWQPPDVLGPEEPEPPLSVMPRPLADLVAMVQVAIEQVGLDDVRHQDPLTGVGVGTEPYVGRVRVAASADDAIELLEPGDILVVRATSPAFNAVLAVAGAIVTAHGGALSHAAVLARELGIPAVVGAHGALDLVDGSTVEVDPIAGRVRAVQPVA